MNTADMDEIKRLLLARDYRDGQTIGLFTVIAILGLVLFAVARDLGVLEDSTPGWFVIHLS